MRVPKVGDTAQRSMEISEKKISAFARLTDDRNRLHFDEVFARRMGFEDGRIGHGMLVSSIVSALVGEDLPGAGAILLEQHVRYVAPTYMGDTITGELKVTKVRRDKPVIALALRIWRDDGTLVADGDAIVLMREPKPLRSIANDVGSQAGITADATSWRASGVDFSYCSPCRVRHVTRLSRASAALSNEPRANASSPRNRLAGRIERAERLTPTGSSQRREEAPAFPGASFNGAVSGLVARLVPSARGEVAHAITLVLERSWR